MWAATGTCEVKCAVLPMLFVTIAIAIATNSMSNTASTWPQLDISPCSY